MNRVKPSHLTASADEQHAMRMNPHENVLSNLQSQDLKYRALSVRISFDDLNII